MNSTTTKRPWGSFTRFTDNENSTVKLLNINKGEQLSLQYHMKRSEFWRVISGNPEIIIDEQKYDAKEGDEFNVSAESKHRIGAPYDDVVILEISKGDFDENDIVRLEDKYNRV
ncbi:MAG: mannose-1-phosphate guanylyltransferase [Parcubacteria bacterium C7867-006]|nr:MAG: mannose-1-phosphate guanylyltransferase [Parcubacteria bacterium C7867-006]